MNARKSEPKINKRFNPRNFGEQRVRNAAGGIEVLTYSGRCLICKRTVYDGAGDPRGVTGPGHYNDGITVTHGGVQWTFPLCFDCDNEEHTHNRAHALAIARAASRPESERLRMAARGTASLELKPHALAALRNQCACNACWCCMALRVLKERRVNPEA